MICSYVHFVHCKQCNLIIDSEDHPNRMFGPAPTAASLGLNYSVSECLEVPAKILKKTEDSGILDLEGIDEEEINTVRVQSWCYWGKDNSL